MTLTLFSRSRPETGAIQRPAIIDIGSNSIRLVVYQGAARLPAIVFNEKVLAGLGRSLNESGRIDEPALEAARTALARFAALSREMGVTELRTVATAAVRDASNGGELLEAARAFGLEVELLSGDEEAISAGHGVLSGIPDADGIVGDLGGGSLELVRVTNGDVGERVSLPLGVLRIAGLIEQGDQMLERRVRDALTDAGWRGAGTGLPFYLVGGSWRALARLDMHLTGYPLPVIHQYCMSAEAIARLRRSLSHLSKAKLKSVENLSSGRIPTLGDAAALLQAVMKELGANETVVSAFGLREGLLYGRLDAAQRREDPLLAAARDEAQRLGRFEEHGDLLDRWIAPLFSEDDAAMARLRHAACLLADVGWRANPEFRAERGLEIALHGNWVAIDSFGRAVMAQALFTCFGGGLQTPEALGLLADTEALEQAKRWGLAMRLAQRLSGGVADPLRRSRLSLDAESVTLDLPAGDVPLYGASVVRRHRSLAGAMGREAVGPAIPGL